MKAAVFIKDAKDYEDPAFDAKEGNKKVGDSLKDVDRELVDISVEYGRGSKNVGEFRENREALMLAANMMQKNITLPQTNMRSNKTPKQVTKR